MVDSEFGRHLPLDSGRWEAFFMAYFFAFRDWAVIKPSSSMTGALDDSDVAVLPMVAELEENGRILFEFSPSLGWDLPDRAEAMMMARLDFDGDGTNTY
jgi:hypothetical protein